MRPTPKCRGAIDCTGVPRAYVIDDSELVLGLQTPVILSLGARDLAIEGNRFSNYGQAMPFPTKSYLFSGGFTLRSQGKLAAIASTVLRRQIHMGVMSVNDLLAGLAFFSLFAVPVILACLRRVPMDEGHGAYSLGDPRSRSRFRSK